MPIEIYQPSDLNRRGRAILDTARRSRARIRDKDGLSLLVLPEEQVERLETIARYALNLLALERALEGTDVALSTRVGELEWGWLYVFDADDLHTFASEIRQALLLGSREDRSDLLDDVLHGWRITAQTLDDPLRRSILLGPLRTEDYSEVVRPEAPRVEPPSPTHP
jgi:hypothetical protein